MSDTIYYSVITDIGRAQFANSIITGIPIKLTDMAVGDGNGVQVTPNGSETELAGEVYRGQINRLVRDDDDPAQIIAEIVILPNVGGFTIREAGVFDDDGNLIIYASLPTTVKPVLPEGTGMDYTLAIRALVGNDVEITLKIDPGVVIATREYVDDAIAAHDADEDAHEAAIAKHNADPNAHNLADLPWMDCGECTRAGDNVITFSGDRRADFPRGKLLRFNGDDAYLCRVYGDPVFTSNTTRITVWFDKQATIPQTITLFERSRLSPTATARGVALVTSTAYTTTQIETLLLSNCYSSVTITG